MTWQDLTVGILEVFAEHRAETFSRRVPRAERDWLVVGPWQFGCRFCGRPKREGHTACDYHAKYHAAFMARMRVQRISRGECISCRDPVRVSQDGRAQRECPRCADRHAARVARCRDRRRFGGEGACCRVTAKP